MRGRTSHVHGTFSWRLLYRRANMTSKTGVGLKIGWIGLGKMGLPITTNLLKAGVDLTVFDTNAELVAKQVANGARAASRVHELAQGMDVVISTIPDDVALRAIA